MPQPVQRRRTEEPTLLCPAAVTDPALLGGVLAVLSDQDLRAVGRLVEEHMERRCQAAVVAELRIVAAQAVADGETDSASAVSLVRIDARHYGWRPPYWCSGALTLVHEDGVVTTDFDAVDTGVEELLDDLTSYEPPSSSEELLTVDLPTGHFARVIPRE